MIPTSLYIHMPWCISKCPYCDFNSHACGNSELPWEAYIDQLLFDFDQEIQLHPSQELSSIFIGGGTPSLSPAIHIKRLLETLANQINFAPKIEITLEANPGCADIERFTGYVEAGVNRLSLGIQSFSQTHLQTLGRIHNTSEAHAAIEAAQAAGFSCINLDLMYGLPQQLISEALSDINAALNYSCSHLSWYQLTIEPNTAFYRRPPPTPNDDMLAETEQLVSDQLERQGYRQYEISAWSLDQRYCQHNLHYWEFGDYLGIGAGAHGKQTTADRQTIRTRKPKTPKQYLAKPGTVDRIVEPRSKKEQLFECMLGAFRLTDGISWSTLEERTQYRRGELAGIMEKLSQAGLVITTQQQLKPSALGRRFYNQLVGEFL